MVEKLNKRKITNDWLKAFPKFEKYKTMHLVHRQGSFLLGLQFESLSSERYRVCFHLYNLMIDLEIPTIPLISSTQLLNKKGAINSFSMNEHNNNLNEVIDELYSQVPLLQMKDISSNDLLIYMKEVKNIFLDETTLNDIVLLNYWCNNEVEKEIKNGKEIISSWRESATVRYGGSEGWEKQIRGLLDKDVLTKTIDEQLKKYKLENIVDYGLKCNT